MWRLVRGLIVIEGLIGVGKTTLCRIVEREWGARLVLEPAEDNPFLAEFYADPQRFAFPAQMFYLANRYAQQLQARQTSLFHPLTVCDYLMAKDGIFAEMTLEGHELTLYRRFAGLLDEEPLRPDFVVFLDSETEVIRSRIARRGISAEQIIPAAYLDDLRERYYKLWDRWDLCPVHVLRTDHVDYVGDPQARAHVLSMIAGWLEGKPLPGSPQPYRESRQRSLFGG
ncbi:deoxyguanosine kinase/deoxyadenosine kinase [Deltaproteobacteria bacterium]|nr:deoxyguanosine kinase/deoxyadenosine kinase [Deltaproteobacteria bacterium]